ncbi:pyruvate decarboxylase [Sesbania bispinosa]|nr:pyruvate decarboxylase [Sesbania bispinosa]
MREATKRRSTTMTIQCGGAAAEGGQWDARLTRRGGRRPRFATVVQRRRSKQRRRGTVRTVFTHGWADAPRWLCEEAPRLDGNVKGNSTVVAWRRWRWLRTVAGKEPRGARLGSSGGDAATASGH